MKALVGLEDLREMLLLFTKSRLVREKFTRFDGNYGQELNLRFMTRTRTQVLD